MNRLIIEIGTLTSHGPRALIECRRICDPHSNLTIYLEGDERGPHRQALGEVPRAIDRIDHPDSPRRPVSKALLLTKHTIVGVLVLNRRPDDTLGESIGGRYNGRISLTVHLLTATKRLHRDGSGHIGQLECKEKVRVHVSMLGERGQGAQYAPRR